MSNNNDDIAVLRDQVSALTETVKNLCDDIAGLSKALETRLSPGNDAAADDKVKMEPGVYRDEMLRSAEPDTIDLTGGKKKGKTKSKQPKVDREKTENKSRGNVLKSMLCKDRRAH